MNIVNKAITGQEQQLDNTEPYSALVEFYNAFNNKDFDLMNKNWLQTEDACMSNPLGGIKRGWDEIKEVYKKILSPVAASHDPAMGQADCCYGGDRQIKTESL